MNIHDATEEAYKRGYEVGKRAAVKRGWWKEYSHSALVRWKDGEPVWEDRTVYRCCRCDFGTIAKHNFCPRCGSDMREPQKEE